MGGGGGVCSGLRRKLGILVMLMTEMWSEADFVDTGLVDGCLGDEKCFRDEKNERVYQMP